LKKGGGAQAGAVVAGAMIKEKNQKRAKASQEGQLPRLGEKSKAQTTSGEKRTQLFSDQKVNQKGKNRKFRGSGLWGKGAPLRHDKDRSKRKKKRKFRLL